MKIYVIAFTFIVMDYMTGLLKAFATRAFESKIMRQGLFHKVALLLVMRHLDSVPYLPPVVREGDTVIWTLTAADTAKPGTGRAELRWYVGEVLAKSRTFQTIVSPALADPSEDVPEADKSAVELLTDRVAGLQQSVDWLDEDARESIRRADETLDSATDAATQAAIQYFKAHPLPAVCG